MSLDPEQLPRLRARVDELLRENDHTRKDMADILCEENPGMPPFTDVTVAQIMDDLEESETQAYRRDGRRYVWFYPAESGEYRDYFTEQYSTVIGAIRNLRRKLSVVDGLYGLEALEDVEELGDALSAVVYRLEDEDTEFFHYGAWNAPEDPKAEELGLMPRRKTYVPRDDEGVGENPWDLI